MPEMDGLQVAKSIRADPELANIPLVLLSSGDADPNEIEAAHLDADLTKPVRESQLFNALTTVLASTEDAEPARSGEAGSPGDVRERRGTVLVAEDNPVNQRVALGMLELLGYGVELVGSGRDAVHAAEARSFDAILMDVQMPDMDGLDAATAIRQFEASRGRHTPIIAMTANARREDRDAVLAAGMDAYLPKPITVEALSEILTAWIRHFDGMEEEPVLDPATLDALRELDPNGDGRLLDGLLQTFIDDADLKVQDLAQAIAQGDPDRVARAAHGLKGGALAIGATRIRALAQEMEVAGKKADLSAAAYVLPQLKAALSQLTETTAGRP
jgi:CheY-like chemotaxis protein